MRQTRDMARSSPGNWGLSSDSKSVATPGMKEVSDDKVNFNSSVYRALVARANYLAQDRPDLLGKIPRRRTQDESLAWFPEDVG